MIPLTMSDASPNGATLWDNQARLGLSKGMYVWLAMLVATCLSSVFFVRDHVPARWVLGGFILSHVIVFAVPPILKLTLRIGHVGLLHLLCWSPGGLLVIVDITASDIIDWCYTAWGSMLMIVVLISFYFDARDGFGYLKWRKQQV